nr:hypothetical protein [Prevotella intermedia]
MHGKSGSFATQNLRFRNAKSKLPFFVGIIFTKPKQFPHAYLKVSRNPKKTRSTSLKSFSNERILWV